MATIISKDGTTIAYSLMGHGPALLLVDGAMCYREFGPMKAIAEALQDQFQVYIYDRRGRGGSGDTEPFDPQREIEDLAAMIAAAGGEVMLFGISSGAILAAHAARELPGIKKLALFEGPMIVDNGETPLPTTFLPDVRGHIAAGRPGEAVKMFLRRVGVPGFGLFMMQLMPMWKTMKKIGVTLPHDLEIVQPYQQGKPLDPAGWRAITMPTLVMDGGNSPAYMRNSQKQWADVLPDATYRTLPGQTHNVKTDAIVPPLREFFQ